jgi:multiple sugar transport system permease protein
MNDVTLFVFFMGNLLMAGLGAMVLGMVFVAKNRPPDMGIWLGSVVGIVGLIIMVRMALNNDPNPNQIVRTISFESLESLVQITPIRLNYFHVILLLQIPAIALMGVAAYYLMPSLSAAGRNVVISTRVDKVGFAPFIRSIIRAELSIFVTIVILLPVAWMILTALKSPVESVAVPPRVFFKPTIDSFVFLTTERTQLLPEELEEYRNSDLSWAEEITARRGQKITRTSDFPRQFRNSLIIAGVSTLLSVGFGVLSAYAFSRFRVPGEDDWLFFILSTRMLPPVVVTIPIFLMYREFGLYDTHLGLILLYTVFNLSFSVWLMKGFIDEIPKEYEEAALVDGYTRMQAFRKVVLPQAVTGIAATTVFCFIFAWNEYAFAAMLTAGNSRTAPPSIPTMQGVGRIEWETIAAASLAFLIPVVIVTFALRRHLLRGVTFGAIRKG